MKTIATLASIFIFAASASAQLNLTNNVAHQEAIRLTMRLSQGLLENRAAQFLANNGLSVSQTVTGVNGWSRIYTLTNDASLVLDFAPGKAGPDGRMYNNGLLQKAFIHSNLVNVPITLTNKSSIWVFP